MSEFPCQECGSKKRFHKKGCSLSSPVHEVLRSSKDVPQNKDWHLPNVDEWYVVSFRTPIEVSPTTGRQIYRIDITLAPVLSVAPHGSDYRVTFDMENTKQFVTNFDGELFSKASDMIETFRVLSNTIEDGIK